MSVYENSILAFIDVLESNSDLISTPDWADLNQWASHLSNDNEEISGAIDNWLQPPSRSQIREAYVKQLKAIAASSPIDPNRPIFGGAKSSTKPHQPSQTAKELLINTIQRNSPLSDSPPAKP